MMKHNIFLEIVLTISLVFVSCQKDEVVPVTSLSVDAMEIKTSYTTADIVWNVESAATIKEVVLEYSTDSTFISAKEVRMYKPDKEANKYAAFLDSLENGTSYYIRCRAINKINSTISKSDSLKTLTYQLANINTDSITQISVSTATLHGTLVNLGSDQKTSVGFYFASHTDVSVEDSCIIVEVSELKDSIHYSYSLSNLVDNITYYVRSFARNVKGVSLGEELSFITKEVFLPEVAPTIIAYVSYTDVICKSEVISDGGGDIIERGFCYSTTPYPTLANEKKVSGDGKGTFSASISGLTANTTYYVRAFARNSKGTVYGEQAEFKTKEYTLPSVSTSVTTKVKYTTATCGGNVSDDGGQEVTEKGICYSTSQYPTVSDNKVSCGSGTGDFECDLSKLSEGTTYYVRAYAINSLGINYGNQSSFVTKEHLLNAIYYTANQKLIETIDDSQSGLHINRFGTPISSHEFEDGEGAIVFQTEVLGIGSYAFSGCSTITSIYLPNSITVIGERAFSGCSELITINIPLGVTNIKKNAFSGCLSLISLSLPSTINTIEEQAFSGCSMLNAINLPSSISNIGIGAFSSCSSLTTISIPSSVTQISDRLFEGCHSLSNITLHDNITEIGYQSFTGCTSLVSFETPLNVYSIESMAFYGCTGLTSVVIKDNVRYIRFGAFVNCSNLTNLILGSRVTSIADFAFSNCIFLSSITCKALNPPSCESSTFKDVNTSAQLYVPASSIDKYQSKYIWKDFNILPIEE